MYISKEEYLAYINNTIQKDRRDLIDAYLKDHALEKKALEGAIAFNEESSFENLLKEIDSKISSSSEIQNPSNSLNQDDDKKDFRIIPRVILSIAAVALALYMAMPQIFSNAQNAPVSTTYFDTYPDVVTNIVRGEPNAISKSKNELIMAMQEYNNGNLTAAFHSLSELNKTQPQDKLIQFYLAITELSQKNYSSSLIKFESLSNPSQRFAYADGARWYQALCLYQLDRKKEAKAILNEISNSPHYKKEEAKRLLMEL